MSTRRRFSCETPRPPAHTHTWDRHKQTIVTGQGHLRTKVDPSTTAAEDVAAPNCPTATSAGISVPCRRDRQPRGHERRARIVPDPMPMAENEATMRPRARLGRRGSRYVKTIPRTSVLTPRNTVRSRLIDLRERAWLMHHSFQTKTDQRCGR